MNYVKIVGAVLQVNILSGDKERGEQQVGQVTQTWHVCMKMYEKRNGNPMFWGMI